MFNKVLVIFKQHEQNEVILEATFCIYCIWSTSYAEQSREKNDNFATHYYVSLFLETRHSDALCEKGSKHASHYFE